MNIDDIPDTIPELMDHRTALEQVIRETRDKNWYRHRQAQAALSRTESRLIALLTRFWKETQAVTEPQ